MIQLLDQIEFAATNGLELLAISMAVALPDICSTLASPIGRSERDDYKEWCRQNLTADKFGFVSADDLWSMRCGVLHNGRFGDLKHGKSVSRVIFPLPGSVTFRNCKKDDAYLYSSADFCRNLCAAVRGWYAAHAGDANVRANLPRMMAYHPKGFLPYIEGVPVIA